MAWMILISTLLAQTNPGDALFGSIPAGTPTFEVTLAGKTYHAAIRSAQDAWLRNEADVSNSQGRIELHFDQPWESSSPYATYASQVEVRREPAALRKDRLQQGWEEAGYVFADTAEGIQPVRKEDLTYAKRAQDMLQDNPSYMDPPAAEDATGNGPDAAGASAIPAWRAWLPHAVILVVGLGALAFILRTFVLRGE